jgi:DNA-binding transcriptional LysR family regulator
MDRLDLIQIFVRVAESGSFSAVAREFSIGQPAVSKQIATLEAQLGAELIRRSSRSLSLTEAGRTFYDSAVRLLDDYEAATSGVGLGHAAPKGLVRAMAPPTFSRLHIAPRVSQFLARYPGIAVELLTSNARTSLIEDGIDTAIHHGELSDSSLIVRKIAQSSITTVATSAFIARHGAPQHPRELVSFPAVVFVERGLLRPWRYDDGASAIIHQPKGGFRTDDADQMRTAVLSDIGLANAPAWLFAKEIASGEVHPLLTRYETTKRIYALRPGSRRLAMKVKVFIDFLEEIFREELSVAA